jgi:hypothetical protein
MSFHVKSRQQEMEKMMALSVTLLAVFVSSSFGIAAQKSVNLWWPQFRGPNSSGLGAGSPPVHFGPAQNVLWKTSVGPGLSSPVVWDDRIFLTEFDQANKQLSTLSIERRTGTILWRRTVAPRQIEEVHELSSPAGATPVTDGESVFVYFGSYGLLSYDMNGNLKWERRLPLPENPYGAVSSPIIVGDLLVLNHQGKDAYLLALNRRDGRTLWKTDRSMFQYGWSTPVHWRHDGIDEIVVLGGTSNQISVSWPTASRMARSAGGLEDCRRPGRALQSSAMVCCSSPRPTSSWSAPLKNRTLTAPRSSIRTTRLASSLCVPAPRVK